MEGLWTEPNEPSTQFSCFHIFSFLGFFLKLETIISLYLTEIKLISMQSAEGVFVSILFTSVFIECTAGVFYLMDIQSLVFREVKEAKGFRANNPRMEEAYW